MSSEKDKKAEESVNIHVSDNDSLDQENEKRWSRASDLVWSSYLMICSLTPIASSDLSSFDFSGSGYLLVSCVLDVKKVKPTISTQLRP